MAHLAVKPLVVFCCIASLQAFGYPSDSSSFSGFFGQKKSSTTKAKPTMLEEVGVDKSLAFTAAAEAEGVDSKTQEQSVISEKNSSSEQTSSAAATSTTTTTTTTKVIYGIRHARSISNDWMSIEGNRWGDATFRDDIKFIDSPISESGHAQTERLLERLMDEEEGQWLSDVELVVISPLTRCLQTFEQGVLSALESRMRGRQTPMPTVLAHSLATERVYTAAETGRPLQDLQTDFPYVDWSLVQKQYGLSEAWWYVGHDDNETYEEWRPANEGQYYAVRGEPDHVFCARMSRLKEWLRHRPERTILLVAHWGVMDCLLGKDMQNCGVCRAEV